MKRALRSRFAATAVKLVRVSTPVIALLLIGLVYFLGIRSERTGFVRDVLDPGIKRITQPVLNAFRGRPPEVMQLELAVGDTTLDSMDLQHARASSGGWMPEVPMNVVGRCAFDGRASDAYIGLRPGPADPREEKRWPLRVLMQRADTVLGIASFDLVPVRDDTPLRAWLLSHALAIEGLPSLFIGLVELRLNDRELGLYMIAERIDATSLARWARGPGPVLRFGDELRTAVEAAKLRTTFPVDPLPQEDWLAAPIMATPGQVPANDPHTLRRYQRAVQHLEDVRGGRRSASDVFDVPSMARLFALCDMLGGQDATRWWNLRFLVDSLSGTFIALPQQYGAIDPIRTIIALERHASPGNGLRDRLFNDPRFFSSYIARLDTFSAEGWLEDLIRELSEGYAAQQRIVVSAYPQTQPDASALAHNREVIRRTLDPPDLVLAYAQGEANPDRTDQRRVALANVHALPVEISAFIAGTDTIPLTKPIVLPPRPADGPLRYVTAQLRPPGSYPGAMTLIAKIIGTRRSRTVPIRTWSTFTAE